MFAAIDDEEPEGEETVELAIQVTSGELILLIGHRDHPHSTVGLNLSRL